MSNAPRNLSCLLAALSLGACVQRDFRVLEPSSTKEVKKSFAAVKPLPVDILFVVDNSGSMAEEQANLARNFEAFINALTSAQGNDYRLAIVTTDIDSRGRDGAELGGLVQASFAGSAPFQLIQQDSSDCRPIAGLKHGCFRGSGARVITSAMARQDQIDAFRSAVSVGTCGSGMEQGLEAMKLALSRTAADCPGQAPFLRESANLVVVFVSNEEDSTSQPPDVATYVDFLVGLKRGAGTVEDAKKKLRTAVVVGAKDGQGAQCSATAASCGGACGQPPPLGSHAACTVGSSGCPSGEFCDGGQCENQDRRFWQYCYWCSFYNAPDCCSALPGSRYIDFAKALEAEVHTAEPDIAINHCVGAPGERVACLVDSICQTEFDGTLRRIATDLVRPTEFLLDPPASYPPGVVVEVNGKRLQICANDTDTNCDYRVTADGRQLSFERNAPGEGDTVEIFFVILEG